MAAQPLNIPRIIMGGHHDHTSLRVIDLTAESDNRLSTGGAAPSENYYDNWGTGAEETCSLRGQELADNTLNEPSSPDLHAAKAATAKSMSVERTEEGANGGAKSLLCAGEDTIMAAQPPVTEGGNHDASLRVIDLTAESVLERAFLKEGTTAGDILDEICDNVELQRFNFLSEVEATCNAANFLTRFDKDGSAAKQRTLKAFPKFIPELPPPEEVVGTGGEMKLWCNTGPGRIRFFALQLPIMMLGQNLSAV